MAICDQAPTGRQAAEPRPIRIERVQYHHADVWDLVVTSWLPLPFVVPGTDMVAIVPERLARRAESETGVRVVEPPFGHVELVEAAWWHPPRAHDPAISWLRGVPRDTGAGLAPAGPPRPDSLR